MNQPQFKRKLEAIQVVAVVHAVVVVVAVVQYQSLPLKETKSATMNIFRFF